MATLALIALFAHKWDFVPGPPVSLDPGALSEAHLKFVGVANCVTCHSTYGRGSVAWWHAFWNAASLRPATTTGTHEAAQGLSAACTGCHAFGGMEERAHNGAVTQPASLAPTSCLNCHTEHKGRLGNITKLTEEQCQSCHSKVIKDFARGHPAFPASFPYNHPVTVRFDHVSHINKHFALPGMADKVPLGGCVGCHDVSDGGRVLRPGNFEQTCANCHGETIAKRDLLLLRWPEIDNSTIAPAEISKSCNLPAEVAAQSAATPFSGVSADPLNALAAYLLDVSADDTSTYEKPVQELARTLMRNGGDPLIEAARSRLHVPSAERLFAGLDTEQVRQAACAWAANQEYAPPGKATLPGWRIDALELRYTRATHADPVVKAWIDTIAALPAASDGTQGAGLKAIRSEMLSATEGPGQCVKCHTLSGPGDGPITVNWQLKLRAEQPLTRFDHRPHLDLLGPEKTCTSCHQLGDGTGPTASVGLKPIALATCTGCHAAGQVRDDCRTCHVYHQGHALKKRMVRDDQ